MIDGKTKSVLLAIALAVGWFGSYLTMSGHPEMGVFLLFASLTSLSRLVPEAASRAFAVLALGAWYVAFPQREAQGGEMAILPPILTGGSAFLVLLLLREIVHALLEGGEDGKESGRGK